LLIRNAIKPGFPKGELTQKEKRTQKEKESLWKLPQPWKSTKEAFGNFLLMISTAAWKSLRQNRSGFPTVTTGPAAAVTKAPYQSSVDHYKGWLRPKKMSRSHLGGADGVVDQLQTKNLLCD